MSIHMLRSKKYKMVCNASAWLSAACPLLQHVETNAATTSMLCT